MILLVKNRWIAMAFGIAMLLAACADNGTRIPTNPNVALAQDSSCDVLVTHSPADVHALPLEGGPVWGCEWDSGNSVQRTEAIESNSCSELGVSSGESVLGVYRRASSSFVLYAALPDAEEWTRFEFDADGESFTYGVSEAHVCRGA